MLRRERLHVVERVFRVRRRIVAHDRDAADAERRELVGVADDLRARSARDVRAMVADEHDEQAVRAARACRAYGGVRRCRADRTAPPASRARPAMSWSSVMGLARGMARAADRCAASRCRCEHGTIVAPVRCSRMTPRIFVGDDVRALAPGADYALPEAAARHVAQALRMRAATPLTLFTGTGGEYATTIARIDRREVVVRVERHDAIERESPLAGDARAVAHRGRHDGLGRAQGGRARRRGHRAVQSARSQRIASERAARRAAHWRQIADRGVRAVRPQSRARDHDVVSVRRSGSSRVEAPTGTAILDAAARRSLAQRRRRRRAARRSSSAPKADSRRRNGARGARTASSPCTSAGACCARRTAAIAALATLDAIAGDAR